MISVSRKDQRLYFMSFLCSTAMIPFLILPAVGQQTDELQEQLQQLKQQYEQTTHDLEQRIAALEQQIEKEKESSEKTKEGTISAAELAAEQAAKKAVLGDSNQVGAQYQGQLDEEPTYDMLQEADQKIA